ncbi:MAG TPA: NHL repeat-containing protein [Solimonas sp.]|nr:NHL repeat-containing protein [Solimonas sp.]
MRSQGSLPGWTVVLAALALVGALSACNGGDESTDSSVDMPTAFGVLGQADFAHAAANRGVALSASGISQPLGGVATDGSKLYLVDSGNNRILGWNSLPANGAAADFVIGQDGFGASAPGTGNTRLALPASVHIANGRLIVADSGNNRVLIWNSLPTANVPANVVVGQAGFNTADPGTSATGLSFPVAAVVGNNRLIVSDQNNNRVLIWNTLPSASGAPADVVIGQADFGLTEAGEQEDGLSLPAGLWSDGFRLLVADSGNNRVMYWTQLPRSNLADASYVIGQSDFARVSAAAGQASLRAPYGLASDGTRIYVADSGNNRVLVFDTFPIANGALAFEVYGQESFTARTPNDDNQDGTSDDGPGARTLSSPTGVSYASGVLYVSDRNNHRVLLFPS